MTRLGSQYIYISGVGNICPQILAQGSWCSRPSKFLQGNLVIFSTTIWCIYLLTNSCSTEPDCSKPAGSRVLNIKGVVPPSQHPRPPLCVNIGTCTIDLLCLIPGIIDYIPAILSALAVSGHGALTEAVVHARFLASVRAAPFHPVDKH